MLVGTLKRGPGDPAPTKGATDQVSAGPKPGSETSSGFMMYLILLIGAALAYGAYTFVA